MSAVRIGRQAAKVRIELLDVDADIEFVRFDLAPDAAVEAPTFKRVG